MSKTKKIKFSQPEDDGISEIPKDIEVHAASLNDDFCNYTVELKTGPTAGEIVSHLGVNIVHNDLRDAFSKLNVHLAYIDKSYSFRDLTAITDIDQMEETASVFFVGSMKISGRGEKKCVVISGTKIIDHGIISVSTPKIMFTGNYPFINELVESLDVLTNEVELYRSGKSVPKFVQKEMEFQHEEDL